VWNGAAFLEQALQSVARQTYRPIEVLVSDDGSNDGSEDLCRQLAKAHGFKLTVQPHRLGWIENCNFLLEQARGQFVCIVPHDDILHEQYIATLASHLMSAPKCVHAFCDVRAFGLWEIVQTQCELTGTPFHRLYQLMTRHFDGTPFRGLIRRDVLARAGGLRANAYDGFAADVEWLARIARFGEIHRVPETLYFKRFHAGSTAIKWGYWEQETKIAAWTGHCAELLRLALLLDLSPGERWLATSAALRRLLFANDHPAPYPEVRSLPVIRKAKMVSNLLAAVDPAFLGGSEDAELEIAVLLVQALTSANTPPPMPSMTLGSAPRTVANLLRFLRKRPPPDPLTGGRTHP
jgi:glycosyltransferase involved in cell wall biosynthesis